MVLAVIDLARAKQTRKSALVIIETRKFNLAIFIFFLLYFIFYLIASTITRMQKSLHLIALISTTIYRTVCNTHQLLGILRYKSCRFLLCEVIAAHCLYRSLLLPCISKSQRTFSAKLLSRLQRLDTACSFNSNLPATRSRL